MKKIFGFAASLILVVVSANAQTVKKEPPPPPPKPKEETVKFTPPKIVKDEEVQKEETVKFTPPKIVKDEEIQVKEVPVITITGKKADEFYKRNPSVSEISRRGNIITLKKKDGTEEKYDMSKKEEDKIFTETYRVSPIPPPPPPKVNLTKFRPPIIIAKGDKADDFYNRNPSAKEISRQGNIIILKMKDGTKQEYNINKKEEMKSFTDQYGESPLPPPPPPPKKLS
jgi:hypothetical protein